MPFTSPGTAGLLPGWPLPQRSQPCPSLESWPHTLERWFYPSPKQGRAGTDGTGVEELTLRLAWGWWSHCPDWPNQLPPRPTSKALSLPTPTSNPSVTFIVQSAESAKKLVLPNHSLRFSMTWGSSRTSERTFGECQTLLLYQKPWTRPIPHWNNVKLQAKLSKQKCILGDTLQLQIPIRWRKRCWRGEKDGGAKWSIHLLCFQLIFFHFFFGGGVGTATVGGADMERPRNYQIWVPWYDNCQRIKKWCNMGSIQL